MKPVQSRIGPLPFCISRQQYKEYIIIEEKKEAALLALVLLLRYDSPPVFWCIVIHCPPKTQNSIHRVLQCIEITYVAIFELDTIYRQPSHFSKSIIRSIDVWNVLGLDNQQYRGPKPMLPYNTPSSLDSPSTPCSSASALLCFSLLESPTSSPSSFSP